MLRPARRVRRCGGALAFGAALLAGSHADAQTVDRGWALERFDPSFAGDRFLGVQHPVYPHERWVTVRGALTLAYAHRPLVAEFDAGSGGAQVPIVGPHLVGFVGLSLHTSDRLAVELSLPVDLLQRGDVVPGIALQAAGAPQLGEPRLGVRVRLWGHADRDPFSVHVTGAGHFGMIPWTPSPANVTDEAFHARAALVMAGRAGIFRWSAQLGYHGRAAHDLGALAHVGSEFLALGAVGVGMRNDAVSGALEIWSSTGFQATPGIDRAQVELLGSVRANVRDVFFVTVGVGAGLARLVGTPQFRALVQLGAALPDGPVERPAPQAATRGNGSSITTATGGSSSASTSTPVAATVAPPSLRFRAPTEPATDPERDADGDGVRDAVDVCVSRAAGATPDPTRAGCPDGDGDHDGVPDHADVCPAQARGAEPDPARRGCPLADRDGDRVGDAVDHCPDQPGAPDTDPQRNGCPGLARLERGRIVIADRVYFDTSSARIQARSLPVLEAVVAVLRARPEILRLSVDGHTDDLGDAEVNIDLSQRRATAVMLWLADHGVEGTRLEAHGYGPDRPIQPNTGAEGRAANRRVEFNVIDPASPSSGAASP